MPSKARASRFLVALAVLLSGSSASAQNLLVNSTFDTGLSSWVAGPNALSNNDGHLMPQQLVHWAARNFSANTYQSVSSSSAGLYTLAGWVRTSGGTTSVKLGAKGCRDGSATDMQEAIIPNSSTKWTIVSFSVQVITPTCQIFFATTAPANEWSSLDEASFSRDPNLLLNPTFNTDLSSWISTSGNAYTNADGHLAVSQLVHWALAAFSEHTSQAVSGLTPGFYTLSGWARAAPTTTTVKLGAKGCLTGTPTDLQEVTIPSNTTSWRRFFVPVRVNQTSCSIFFSTMGAGHAWSTLDDVIFRKTTRPIVDVALTRADNSTPVRYNSSSSKFIFSDGFMTAWGANDHLYTITNDTRGWNNATHASRGRNLSFDSFGLTSPPNLAGSAINTMDRFGVVSGSRAEMNPNLNRLKWYMWKANSVTSIDGYLYMTVSRHSYGGFYIDFRQQAKDSSILISKDNGVTWSPLPPSQGAPFASANVMFPGSKFTTPFFVEYGKDGAAPVPAVDASDQFVYAVSNDGYWNNGSHMYLGRVPRPPIATRDSHNAILDKNEWRFYNPVNGTWGSLAAATPILSSTKTLSQAGITYVPAVGRYIMMQWYYNTMNTTEVDGNCGPWDPVADSTPWPGPTTGPNFYDSDTTCVRHSRWSIYEAPKPWGPWNLVREIDQPGGANMGWYNPIVPNKFISGTPTYNATTGRWRVEAWAFTVGNFMDFGQTPEENPNGWYTWANTRYTLYMVPISFYW